MSVYEGETAYITGGASGIGLALATKLVKNGMKVYIADRNLEGAQAAVKSFNQEYGECSWAVQVDVAEWESQQEAFAAAADNLGHIDYVFAVAGITERPWMQNQPETSHFEKPDLSVFDVNARGVFYTSALAIQQFRRQPVGRYGYRGKIIAVASACSFYYIPSLPIYTAAKHAVLGFVRTSGQTLPCEQITLNAVCPNIVRTGISTGDFYNRADREGLLIDMSILLSTFEYLIGDTSVSGEAFEVLPGSKGYRIKERAEYTNDEVKRSVEITQARSARPK